MANLIITDNSGSIPLVLWDQDVDLVSKKIIKENTPVKIINGYVKDGYQGLELGVGRWSSIEILEESSTPPPNNSPIPSSSITGIIQDISPTNAFFKDDGSFGFVTKLRLKTKEKIHTITVWDEQVKHLQTFKKGDTLQIDNVDIRNQQGNKEIHINGNATIKKC